MLLDEAQYEPLAGGATITASTTSGYASPAALTTVMELRPVATAVWLRLTSGHEDAQLLATARVRVLWRC